MQDGACQNINKIAFKFELHLLKVSFDALKAFKPFKCS